jgi:hypothetical protein
VPVPEFPFEKVIHDELLDADQAHDVVVLTNALLAMPAELAETLAGDTLKLQPF